MGYNYGIGFCREGIRVLEAEEDRLFRETGSGFTYMSRAALQLAKYKRMLARFEAERNAGVRPSYSPDKHGQLNCE